MSMLLKIIITLCAVYCYRHTELTPIISSLNLYRNTLSFFNEIYTYFISICDIRILLHLIYLKNIYIYIYNVTCFHSRPAVMPYSQGIYQLYCPLLHRFITANEHSHTCLLEESICNVQPALRIVSIPKTMVLVA